MQTNASHNFNLFASSHPSTLCSFVLLSTSRIRSLLDGSIDVVCTRNVLSDYLIRPIDTPDFGIIQISNTIRTLQHTTNYCLAIPFLNMPFLFPEHGEGYYSEWSVSHVIKFGVFFVANSLMPRIIQDSSEEEDEMPAEYSPLTYKFTVDETPPPKNLHPDVGKDFRNIVFGTDMFRYSEIG